MNRLKRAAALVLAGLLTVSLAACNVRSEAEEMCIRDRCTAGIRP